MRFVAIWLATIGLMTLAVGAAAAIEIAGPYPYPYPWPWPWSSAFVQSARGVCPQIHQPVCAVTPQGIRQTFSNACFARAARARVLHPGACVGGPFCIMLFNPVCAVDPATGRRKTYPSLCEAENANARWLSNGSCERGRAR
jgi:hypothetical protein